MKLSKARLQKTINNTNKQTRKKFKKGKKVLNHTNTVCYKKHNTKQFNLRNRTLRNWSS
jgi:hypothetical protein